jgi:hypothetical protein
MLFPSSSHTAIHFQHPPPSSPMSSLFLRNSSFIFSSRRSLSRHALHFLRFLIFHAPLTFSPSVISYSYNFFLPRCSFFSLIISFIFLSCISMIDSSCHALPSSFHSAVHFSLLLILPSTSLNFSSCQALPTSSHPVMNFPHLLIMPCTSLIFSSYHALPSSSHPAMHFPTLLLLPGTSLIFSSCHVLPSSVFPVIQLQHLRILPCTSIIFLSYHALPSSSDPA